MAVTPDTYPNSSIFINKLGVINSKDLAEAEADFTFLRAEEYRSTPYKGQFDLSHLQQVHFQLFSDLYEWAGQIEDIIFEKISVNLHLTNKFSITLISYTYS